MTPQPPLSSLTLSELKEILEVVRARRAHAVIERAKSRKIDAKGEMEKVGGRERVIKEKKPKKEKKVKEKIDVSQFEQF